MYNSKKYDDNRPNVGVTIVPFIYEDNTIKTLLYKRAENSEEFSGYWSLPNAFFDIKSFETLEDAAKYALAEKTSVSVKHIEQVHTFSGLYIDPNRINTVNVCYLSLCNNESIKSLAINKFETEWVSIEYALKRKLAFNHHEVLKIAYERLKAKSEYTALTAHMLNNMFTIAEFKSLTELLINKNLDNSRFRDRIKKTDVLIPVPNEFKLGANRPAQLYRLNNNYKDYFYPMSLTKPN